jgi:hypothetical protein
MKTYILLLFAFVSFFSFSQQKRFEINWQGTILLQTSNSSIEVPSFDKEHFAFDYTTGLSFYAQWDNTTPINENSVELTDISYTTISSSELKSLPLNTIPSSVKFNFKNTIARDKRSAFIELSPIIKENGVFKKITAFTINFNTSSSFNTSQSFQSTQAISNSVLSSGSWHKFYVEKSGVYRLSRSFLSQLGVNTNVDPRTIKIFGNGGAMLPFSNSSNYPFDLTENAIKFVGEQDGVFNNDDFILFYAEGPKGNPDDPAINTNINPYTDKSYYFVNVSNGNGKRIQSMSQPEAPADYLVNTFQDYQFHEQDEFNLQELIAAGAVLKDRKATFMP